MEGWEGGREGLKRIRGDREEEEEWVGGEEYFWVWFWWRVKGERKWKRKMH